MVCPCLLFRSQKIVNQGLIYIDSFKYGPSLLAPWHSSLWQGLSRFWRSFGDGLSLLALLVGPPVRRWSVPGLSMFGDGLSLLALLLGDGLSLVCPC